MRVSGPYALAALMFVVLAGCDWSQYGFDTGHSGWNPTEQTITPVSVQGLTIRWSGLGRRPVVGGGLVLSVSNDNTSSIVARDTQTGAVRWTKTGGFGGPAISGDTVYATTGASATTLHAINLATGNDRWR